IQIGGVPQPLVTPYLGYRKYYRLNGGYYDTDGYIGTWGFVNHDSLLEKISGSAVPVNCCQGYKVISLSYNTMTLSYYSGGKKVQASFIAVK
ncbi:MAG TPA: hypothetical protein VG842_08725, partial [Sediminibacterium sp.]|nr:hypothetical protein [Sediminibacterium sp.]